jgi:Holliday junction resolvase-like predicted endonuclease
LSIEDWVEHERIVDLLFRRLRSTGRYQSLQKHVEYGNRKVHGEADIVATTHGHVHYYEVKIHANASSFYNAIHQFKRFDRVVDMTKPKYIYVTPTQVRRVYIDKA